MPPAGFKRSRAVWDNAIRRPHASRVDAVQSWWRAILYELQPVRGLAGGATVNNAEAGKIIQQYAKVCGMVVYLFATTTVPIWAATVLCFLRARTLRQWCILVAVLLYYIAVRYIHHVLEAGPLVIITTALVAIFTIGLGDKDENDDDGISAYSVFNRGFQRLLGSVDADQLLAQHVGGGMMGMGGFMGNNGGGGGGDGMVMGLQEPNNAPRRRRVINVPDADVDEVDPPRAPADGGDEDENDENDENENRGGANRARPSGKKARRRNLDQRLELRRQRDAAAAMGFGGAGNNEVEAMQRLLDDQIVVGRADIMEEEEG
jgi:Uncharacterized conserved domain (SAYSvFN)